MDDSDRFFFLFPAQTQRTNPCSKQPNWNKANLFYFSFSHENSGRLIISSLTLMHATRPTEGIFLMDNFSRNFFFALFISFFATNFFTQQKSSNEKITKMSHKTGVFRFEFNFKCIFGLLRCSCIYLLKLFRVYGCDSNKSTQITIE